MSAPNQPMGFLHTLYYLQMLKIRDDAKKKFEEERRKKKEAELNKPLAKYKKVMNKQASITNRRH